MTRTLTLAPFAVLALSLLTVSAHADWDRGTPHAARAYPQHLAYSQQIDARQARQVERIRFGVQTGQLTRREFRKLMREQDRIQAMEHHFRADGRLDARETARLDQALDQARRHIRVQMHDQQARTFYGQASRYN